MRKETSIGIYKKQTSPYWARWSTTSSRVQSSVWTERKYWTVPCERCVRSNFSACRKLVGCRPRAENLSGFLFVFFFFTFLFFFFFLLDKRFTTAWLLEIRSRTKSFTWRDCGNSVLALMVWRKTTSFFLILGIFPMFWRVMICYSRPHGWSCLLNLSTKASGLEPVLIAIEMSGLARIFWSIIR